MEELLDQWYGPEDIFFKVRANDSNMYILRRRSSASEGEWSLECRSVRHEARRLKGMPWPRREVRFGLRTDGP